MMTGAWRRIDMGPQELAFLSEIDSVGIVYPDDRSSPPHNSRVVKYSLANLKQSEMQFADVDRMLESKLVKESPYAGFTYLQLTYAGRQLLLASRGFDLERWQRVFGKQICCEQAIPDNCVCLVKTWCPTHGARCHGTHD